MLHPRGYLTIWSNPGSQVPKFVVHDEGISQYNHHFDPLKQLKHTINNSVLCIGIILKMLSNSPQGNTHYMVTTGGNYPFIDILTIIHHFDPYSKRVIISSIC